MPILPVSTPAMPRRLSRRAALILALGGLAVGGLSGCAGPGAGLPALPPPAAGPYRLGPGDQLRIMTYGDDQLTGDFAVGDGGTIALPLLGAVPAAGRTLVQLETEIAQALSAAGLYRNPSVIAEVTQYRPIFVLGEVNRPGEYPWQPGMTAVSAVAVAGGFTYRAVEGYVSVVRVLGGVAVEARARRQDFVKPGDVITVFERRF